MNYLKVLLIITSCIIFASSCCEERVKPDTVVVGEVLIDMDASKQTVRSQEALIGNMVADAFMEYVLLKDKAIDFAVINGGNLRINKDIRPDGIYPAGEWTREMVEELLPFGNFGIIVSVTGAELKSIFERSVAQLPLAKGPFLQVSKEVKIVIDTSASQQPQIINETQDQIVTEGSRIISIKINAKEYNTDSIYIFMGTDFMIEGNDGHVTLANISDDKKENLGEDLVIALENYLKTHSPVQPELEGRITFFK